ncbi:ISKra4 family transposase [Methylocystis rosea]|uniref:ISKra4 family transposase n=1 Tax=Methylocystis rosea TaxID=173366 RepID=UPI001FE1DD63|nr:ISKra4 family transposase [Methylocystis rosea]
MRWKITIEGLDEFSGRDTAEMVIEKDVGRLSKGELGLTIADGKSIMTLLQQLIVKQQCEAYVLTSRYCTDCQTFRRIKDYGKRKIRTVYGRVEVSNPRIMNCRRCVPYFCDASTVLRDICPDQATPELMELSARLGSLMPYRKAADVLAEFLPIPSTESFMTLRHRTMKLGERLDEKARQREWFEPPSSSEHKQAELDLPNDPEREFVVSIDTAHVRCSRSEKARTFEITVARCGRGRRGSPPGHYFATADTSKHELRSRALQALQHEGYVGRGEVTVISDGAEIMKRLPKALPKPTAHIIDWFHIAMKIQPMQQIADHIVCCRDEWTNETVVLDEEIRALKWKLWHGQVDRAMQQLEKLIADMAMLREQGDESAGRIGQLGQALLTYIRQNKAAIVDYGARYRSGRRIASSLAESAVDTLVARRMVKKQQMQWSLKGAHRMLQVRAAMLNGDLSKRLAWQPPKPTHRYHFAWMFEPTPPLLKAAA